MPGDAYQEVLKANVILHSRMAQDYHKEPHFRPENIAHVDDRLSRLIRSVSAKRVLDLGCGTGFIIQIVKKYVAEVHGVDATQAMLDLVDTSGSATVRLFCGDTGTFDVEAGAYDLVTCYSFLHHLYDVQPTFRTAYQALRGEGKFFCDLEPNVYYWDSLTRLDPSGAYDPLVRVEIEKLRFQDHEVATQLGISKDLLNQAEYGKNVKGGFEEEDLRAELRKAGFQDVEVFYYWYLGQAKIVNDPAYPRSDGVRLALLLDATLQAALPLSRSLFKYVGFVATK